jgi:hypothetical protein
LESYLASSSRSRDIRREIATGEPQETMYYYNTKSRSKLKEMQDTTLRVH